MEGRKRTKSSRKREGRKDEYHPKREGNNKGKLTSKETIADMDETTRE